jgi:N-acetylmuramoyl-L-alanine amidase
MTRGRLAVPFLLLVLSVGTARAGLPTTTYEGRSYVELARVAETLKSRLEAGAESSQARLHAGDRVVTLIRNWARILVDGAPLLLDAPVVVRKGVWLVPETFLTQIASRLSPPTVAPAPAPPPRVVAQAPAPRPTPLSAPSTPASGARLEEMRTRSYPSFTRIVLETSAPVTHRVEASGGKELRIRLLGLSGEPQVEAIAEGPVDEVRLERAGADSLLRVSFEGGAPELKTSTLADPPRLVLDFARPAEPAARGGLAAGLLRTIVIDAGHGGHDSGAVGPGGLQEKELVLDVTRRVSKLAEERLGVKVLLSRDGDHFVTLRDRTSYANRERADLFVSIHANAHRVVASEGLEVYFLSSEATDNASRQVAAAENSVVQLEKPSGARAASRTDIVKTMLWDLAQAEFQNESSRLAETVLDSMTQALRIPNRGVKQAGFYVLGGAAMPAILIEIGFVTNPREEKRLKESRYRDEIARAIVAGLADYKRAWDLRARPAAARTP